jgi:hypothetical protein
MKLILVNGPPYSGKDTIAKHLYGMCSDHHNVVACEFERFSAPLKTSFSAISGTSHNEFYENNVYEQVKDEVIPWLGVSYRQYQINLSEKHFKPLYGDNIFARLLFARLDTYNKDVVVLVPDLGFDIEIDTAEKTMEPNEVLLIRCHRPGFTAFDSRKYVYSEKFKSVDLNNDKFTSEFINKAEKVFEAFMGNQSLAKFNETPVT